MFFPRIAFTFALSVGAAETYHTQNGPFDWESGWNLSISVTVTQSEGKINNLNSSWIPPWIIRLLQYTEILMYLDTGVNDTITDTVKWNIDILHYWRDNEISCLKVFYVICSITDSFNKQSCMSVLHNSIVELPVKWHLNVSRYVSYRELSIEWVSDLGWYCSIAPCRNSVKNCALLLKQRPVSCGIRTWNFRKRPLAGETRGWAQYRDMYRIMSLVYRCSPNYFLWQIIKYMTLKFLMCMLYYFMCLHNIQLSFLHRPH